MKNGILKVMMSVSIAALLLSGCGSNSGSIEGVYYKEVSEEFYDYTVTVNHYYDFKADNTGMMSIQDDIPFTWKDGKLMDVEGVNEIGSYRINGDELTIKEGEVSETYTRVSGKCVKPQEYHVDKDNTEDGRYSVDIFSADDIIEDGENVKIKLDLFTVDTYDIADVNTLKKSDAIIVGQKLYIVDSIEDVGGGKNINGGLEEGGTALKAMDEDNCYVYWGMDDYMTYTKQFTGEYPVSEDLVFEDSWATPGEVRTGGLKELKEALSEEGLNHFSAFATIEDGVIINVQRVYVP